MKPITTLFLCIVFVLGVQAENQQVTYPFKIENKRIILQYPENGQLLQMIFSSVFPVHVLSAKAADKLHYEYLSKGDSFPVGNYMLPIYQPKKVTNFYFFTADFSKADDYKDFDGIIGCALLDSNVVDVDFQNKRISVMKAWAGNLSGRKTDTLQMQTGSFIFNKVYTFMGTIEYNHKKEPACFILNLVDIPVQAAISESVYDEKADPSLEILSPAVFRYTFDKAQLTGKVSVHSSGPSYILLGLSFLQKYKNVIFDYPHNRVLLID